MKIDDKNVLKFLGFVFLLMGLMLFAYVAYEGLILQLDHIPLMTNPLFHLILGLCCWLTVGFLKITDRMVKD